MVSEFLIFTNDVILLLHQVVASSGNESAPPNLQKMVLKQKLTSDQMNKITDTNGENYLSSKDEKFGHPEGLKKELLLHIEMSHFR